MTSTVTQLTRTVSMILLSGVTATGCDGRQVLNDPCGTCPWDELCGSDKLCHRPCNTVIECDACQDCSDGLCSQLTEEACAARICDVQSCPMGCCRQNTCIDVSAPATCGNGGQTCADCTAERRADSCSADKGCVCAAIGALCPEGQYCEATECSSTCTPRCDGKCGGSDICEGTCPDNCVPPETCGGGGSEDECGCTLDCAGICGGDDGCGGTCPNNCVEHRPAVAVASRTSVAFRLQVPSTAVGARAGPQKPTSRRW